MLNAPFGIVERLEVTTAKQLLDGLSQLGPVFGRFSRLESWAFRGHADSQWKLLPSALRPDGLDGLFDFARLGPECRSDAECHAVQCFAEARVLSYFHSYCDLSARVVPEDSQNTRRLIDHAVRAFGGYTDEWRMNKGSGVTANRFPGCQWPAPDLLSPLALAQHSGIPTRLLDWSRSPYTAAYFAAEGAVRESSKSFAIWAILTTPLSVGHALRDVAEFSGVRLEVVTAPRAGNPNLHAQQGLFTLIAPSDSFPFSETDRRPVDELFADAKNPNGQYSPLLIEFTCPSKLAPEVLWALDKLDVNASTIYPDYAGAAKAVRDFPLQRPCDDYS